MLCGTFWKGVPSGTKGAPSIDLIWVPLSDVLHQDSKCAPLLHLAADHVPHGILHYVRPWPAGALPVQNQPRHNYGCSAPFCFSPSGTRFTFGTVGQRAAGPRTPPQPWPDGRLLLAIRF